MRDSTHVAATAMICGIGERMKRKELRKRAAALLLSIGVAVTQLLTWQPATMVVQAEESQTTGINQALLLYLDAKSLDGAPRDDAAALEAILAKTNEFDSSNITTYEIPEDSNEDRKSAIWARISEMAEKTDENSLTVIAYSGHGGINMDGTSYLAAGGVNNIFAPELREQLDKLQGRVLVLISACHSGGTIMTASEFEDGQEVQGSFSDTAFIDEFLSHEYTVEEKSTEESSAKDASVKKNIEKATETSSAEKSKADTSKEKAEAETSETGKTTESAAADKTAEASAADKTTESAAADKTAEASAADKTTESAAADKTAEASAADKTTESAAADKTAEASAADKTTESAAADKTAEASAADKTTENAASGQTTEDSAAEKTTAEAAGEEKSSSESSKAGTTSADNSSAENDSVESTSAENASEEKSITKVIDTDGVITKKVSFPKVKAAAVAADASGVQDAAGSASSEDKAVTSQSASSENSGSRQGNTESSQAATGSAGGENAGQESAFSESGASSSTATDKDEAGKDSTGSSSASSSTEEGSSEKKAADEESAKTVKTVDPPRYYFITAANQQETGWSDVKNGGETVAVFGHAMGYDRNNSNYNVYAADTEATGGNSRSGYKGDGQITMAELENYFKNECALTSTPTIYPSGCEDVLFTYADNEEIGRPASFSCSIASKNVEVSENGEITVKAEVKNLTNHAIKIDGSVYALENRTYAYTTDSNLGKVENGYYDNDDNCQRLEPYDGSHTVSFTFTSEDFIDGISDGYRNPFCLKIWEYNDDNTMGNYGMLSFYTMMKDGQKDEIDADAFSLRSPMQLTAQSAEQDYTITNTNRSLSMQIVYDQLHADKYTNARCQLSLYCYDLGETVPDGLHIVKDAENYSDILEDKYGYEICSAEDAKETVFEDVTPTYDRVSRGDYDIRGSIYSYVMDTTGLKMGHYYALKFICYDEATEKNKAIYAIIMKTDAAEASVYQIPILEISYDAMNYFRIDKGIPAEKNWSEYYETAKRNVEAVGTNLQAALQANGIGRYDFQAYDWKVKTSSDPEDWVDMENTDVFSPGNTYRCTVQVTIDEKNNAVFTGDTQFTVDHHTVENVRLTDDSKTATFDIIHQIPSEETLAKATMELYHIENRKVGEKVASDEKLHPGDQFIMVSGEKYPLGNAIDGAEMTDNTIKYRGIKYKIYQINELQKGEKTGYLVCATWKDEEDNCGCAQTPYVWNVQIEADEESNDGESGDSSSGDSSSGDSSSGSSSSGDSSSGGSSSGDSPSGSSSSGGSSSGSSSSGGSSSGSSSAGDSASENSSSGSDSAGGGASENSSSGNGSGGGTSSGNATASGDKSKTAMTTASTGVGNVPITAVSAATDTQALSGTTAGSNNTGTSTAKTSQGKSSSSRSGQNTDDASTPKTSTTEESTDISITEESSDVERSAIPLEGEQVSTDENDLAENRAGENEESQNTELKGQRLWIYLILIWILAVLLGFIIFILFKRRKNKEEEQR